MRRSLVVLASVFMLAALAPSEALARPAFSITSLTVTGVGTGTPSGTCMLHAQVNWTAANQIKAVRFIEDSGSSTSESLVSVVRGANSVGQYFYGVDLDAFSFRWGTQLIGGGGKELTINIAWTDYETWNDIACPSGTQTLAVYSSN